MRWLTIMLIVVLTLAASATALLLVGSEPELQEVVVEVRTARAPAVGAVVPEMAPRAAGLAATVPEVRTARAGLAATVPEVRTARAGLAAAIIEIHVPPNAPPVAVCQDVLLPLDSAGQAALAPFDVDAGSYDPDGDPITLDVDPTSFGCADLGDQLVTLSVTDDGGLTDTCPATVTVVDVSPPVVSLAVSPDHLWPPNHEGVEMSPSASLTDGCAVTGAVVTVESNEPDDAQGGGDGHTIADIVILDASGEVKADSAASGVSNALASSPFEVGDRLILRAERLGRGARDEDGDFIGRNYTVTITATDESGNETSASVIVNVPHDDAAHRATCDDPECAGD